MTTTTQPRGKLPVPQTTGVPAYQVALAFEDGVTRFISVREDQTVADASYTQRINIPLDCRDGACGTCKAFCESGDYDGGIYLDDALSDAEAAAGYVLPCSMKPRSDLALQIATTSAMAKTGAATFRATVTALEQLTPTTVALTLATEQRADLAFLPGQYVNIAVPGTEESRSYSFANGPHEDDLTFLIKLTPGGVMSTWLTERAAVGDELAFTGPHGSFFLRETERPILMLAGGTGLAPILSMLRRLRAEGSDRRGHLIYGVGNDEDIVRLDEITDLVEQLPGMTWDHCVSNPASRAQNRGYIPEFITPEHLHDGDVAVYLCGPPAMVEAVRADVGDKGIEPYGFYYEKFATAAPAGTPEPSPTEGGIHEPVTAEAAAASSVVPEQAGHRNDGSLATGEVNGAVAQPFSSPVGGSESDQLLLAEDARSVAGQQVLSPLELHEWDGARPAATSDDTALRQIAGQVVLVQDGNSPGEGGSPPRTIDQEGDLVVAAQARSIAGQESFPANDLEPLVAPSPAPTPSPATGPGMPSAAVPPAAAARSGIVTDDGYVIGEEHPDIAASDALFEARAALELGAVDLTLGRLNSRQLAGYRLLADATLPYVEGDRFVDAAAYTETNAAFHDYLFGETGNRHLLAAYQALGVKGRMGEVLRNATWCHPQCATDHVEIVEAFERRDRDAVRQLMLDHAERSKETMRRAMVEAPAAGPRFLSPGRFTDTVVVVTGAAQGIGAQVARRIATEGGSVVLADRSPLVQELVDDLSREGLVAHGIECDLEQSEGARVLVEKALDLHGRIDVLVNNVGGAINFKPFVEFTGAEIQAEVTRSLMTTLYASRAVVPGMIERGRGVIVNVSSAATRGVHRIPYSAAKGGINALTASLAFELAEHGIRVVATAPGGTEAPERRISRGTPTPGTDTERAWFQSHIDQTLGSSLMHRYGTLDEQAAAICFLASPEASYITGTVLPVAGGDLG